MKQSHETNTVCARVDLKLDMCEFFCSIGCAAPGCAGKFHAHYELNNELNTVYMETKFNVTL